MGEYRMDGLDGARPADWLAALGLCSLVEGGRLWFDVDHVPMLEVPIGLDEVVDEVRQGLVELTYPGQGWSWPSIEQRQRKASLAKNLVTPPLGRTTTPTWDFLEDPCLQSWQDPVVDALLHTFDVGAAKTLTGPRQAPAAALVLISGRSHLRTSVTAMWEALCALPKNRLPATPAAQMPVLEEALRAVLGQPGSGCRVRAMGFRYTACETTPRLSSGYSEALVEPLHELLALAGVCRLLPTQRRAGDTHGRDRGLAWSLNSSPMELEVLVEVHELACPVPGWPRFTCGVQTAEGAARYSLFTPVERLETP